MLEFASQPGPLRLQLGWVVNFLQILIQVNFLPAHLKHDSPRFNRGESGWLTNLQIKDHTSFFIVWVLYFG